LPPASLDAVRHWRSRDASTCHAQVIRAFSPV
jgi:hypothetical protein